MGKPKYQDLYKNQTARIFARAYSRLAAEMGLSTSILGVDLNKEGFKWDDEAVYGFKKAFPRPQIYYVTKADRAQATRDPETGRFEQRNRYGDYLAAQTRYPSALQSDQKEKYNKAVVWCDGDSRDSDRNAKAKHLNCIENAKINAKLVWLFKDLQKFIDAIKAAVKKNNATEKFNVYALQAALDEAENNLQSYKYNLGAQYSYNTRDLETLYSIAPIMRWFFEVAPKLAPAMFQKTSKLLPFYAKLKAQGKNAVQDYPWFCDIDTTPNAATSTIQKGMFMQDWDALAALSNEAPTTETPVMSQAAPVVVVRETTTNDIDKTKTVNIDKTKTLNTSESTGLSTRQKVVIAVVSVSALGGLFWWLSKK